MQTGVLFAVLALSGAAATVTSAAETTPRYVESLQRLVEAEVEKLDPTGGFWGVYAVDLSTNNPIVDLNGDFLFLPASNRKLFSTALALRRLGADFQFTTRLWMVGDLDETGTLQGDLVLETSGDPTLRPTFLNGSSGLVLLSDWARAASAAGIQKVEGRVIVDCSVYLEPALMPPGWGWDQLTELYGALPSALAMNENRVVVKTSPGRSEGSPCTVETVPDLPAGLALENSARTAGSRGKNTLKLVRGTGPAALVLVGELPRDVAPVSRTVPLPDPATGWAEAFGSALERAGVSIAGPVEVSRRREAPESQGVGARLLAEHTSPPLSRIVRHTNKESDNQCAEMLYLAVGAKEVGQASYAASQLAERSFLRELGIDPVLVEGEDGCGLSRTDLVAPRAIVRLLERMASGAEAEAFLNSLPVSGRDGTLSYRMSGDGMKERVMAKTGTLRDVVALSGYIKRADGRRIAFSLLANHYTKSAASLRAAQDRICGLLYRADLP